MHLAQMTVNDRPLEVKGSTCVHKLDEYAYIYIYIHINRYIYTCIHIYTYMYIYMYRYLPNPKS